MKIVIDIPEIAYEAYKEWHKNKVATVSESLIANGKPYEDRQEGKWIDYSDTDGFVECPFCHKATTCEDNIDELHYCWKCGAKLRKGELYREETCENRFDCPSYQKQNCIGCENCKKGGAE